jgi:hypothetical protein
MTEPRKKPILLELPTEMVLDTDQLARRLSMSRVALVSQAIAMLLTAHGVDGYDRPALYLVQPNREPAEIA